MEYFGKTEFHSTTQRGQTAEQTVWGEEGGYQGFEILRPIENYGEFKIFHKFLMQYSDPAPKPGQNDAQLLMFSTTFDSV